MAGFRSWKPEVDLLLGSDCRLRTTKLAETEILNNTVSTKE